MLASGCYDTTILVWDVRDAYRQASKPSAVRLSSDELEKLWHNLAGADTRRAYRAIEMLGASGAKP